MRLSAERMAIPGSTIGPVTRSERNAWATQMEEMVRDLAPKPISYDVDSTQPVAFTEYSYTELLGGVYVNTQSIEINCRLIELAGKTEFKVDYTPEISRAVDKYDLSPVETDEWPAKVAIMVGHNCFDLISNEIVARAAFEHPDFYVKLHPLTNDEYAAKVAHFVGWDRILDNMLSGVDLIKNCEVAYVSTATELAMLAVSLGKPIVNISNFFNEAGGIYYPINRLLFKSDTPNQLLANILDCEFSGIIHPWTPDPEKNLRSYFDKTLELREIYGEVASPNMLKKVRAQ